MDNRPTAAASAEALNRERVCVGVTRRSPQEIADAFRDLAGMRFQGEVTGIEEADNRARIVPLERLGAGGTKNGSFLPHTAKSGGL